MRIPEVRQEMYDLANELREYGLDEEADVLCNLAEETKRRYTGRGRRVSRSMTPAIEQEIRNIHIMYPDTTQLEIARHVGVSDGRVSETLRGFRT